MKFNFDSKIVSLQVPSGILWGLMATFVPRLIRCAFIPAKTQLIICAVIILDILHLLGRIDVDISNLFKRYKSLRTSEIHHERQVNDRMKKIIQIYVEEHAVFIICLLVSTLGSHLLLVPLRK